MAFSDQETNSAKAQRGAWSLRRRVRERRDRQEGESFTRHARPITREINANERDAARLHRSREQVRKGEVHWGVEDGEESLKNDAGG